MANKVKEVIGIQEAMGNLAAIIGIDLANPGPIRILRNHRIVTDPEEFGPEIVEWLAEEGVDPIVQILDATYRAIHQHLSKLADDPEMNWENEKSRKGTAAMMDLVGESADRMDAYFAYRFGKTAKTKISDRDEYKSLQSFYRNRFAPKFKDGIEGDAAWKEEWAENEEASLLDLSQTGLKDFEAVRQDREYELFYIRNESGKPYFNSELLRNIRLTCDFEVDAESFEEDPLLKVRAMQDRDLLASAGQILGECHPAIVDFYKVSKSLAGNDLAQSLGTAILALFLAANPRHLVQNTIGKSCLQYFDDFHRFLRNAMRTAEYQKLIAYPPDRSDKNAHILLYLTHVLSRALFERIGGVKQEAIGLIHRSMRKGEEIKQKEKEHLLKGQTIWNQLQIDDEKFRTLLAKFPNGPLFKILDLIREEDQEPVSFDPIGQENLPLRLYQIERKGKKIDVLRLPSPTRQIFVNKVEVIDEFRAFLRALAADQPARRHLLINLQDRTSWKEFARSRALEELQKNAEFSSQIFVLTLPKDTDFYHQNNEYLNLNKADDFFAAFKEQLRAPEECGFFIPSKFKPQELAHFVDQAFPLIHEHFFSGKNSLTRRNREDFIEIFYQLLVLKCIDLFEPTSISFTCKDAIDTSSAEQGMFFGFLKLLTSDLSAREDLDFLRWLIYTPALFIRERAIDPERFNRLISTLERVGSELSEKGKQIAKDLDGLYTSQTIKSLIVKNL